MPQQIRLWSIKKKDLNELHTKELPNEQQLEDWIERDISVLDSDLLVIGRQVSTSYGGIIDLLCLDSQGDTVIIELKKGKTPREVTAQVIDYGAWINILSAEQIVEIANNYLQDFDLEKRFADKFGVELPETINENHRMLIVASVMDDSTERIINYLSDAYGVGINVATFQYFEDNESNQFLGRFFMIEPQKVEASRVKSKKRRNLTFEELERMADEKGLGSVHNYLVNNLGSLFDIKRTTKSSVTFLGRIDEIPSTVLNIFPGRSLEDQGLYVRTYIERLAKYLNVEQENAISVFPAEVTNYELREVWEGSPFCLDAYFKDIKQAEKFIQELKKLKMKE